MAAPRGLEILDIHGNFMIKACAKCGRRWELGAFMFDLGEMTDLCPACRHWRSPSRKGGIHFHIDTKMHKTRCYILYKDQEE